MMECTAFVGVVYATPGMLATPSVVDPATAGLCGDPFPSQRMNHMFSLEASHKIDNLYPRAPLSDKSCNTNFMPS